jgi:hypothetical protein
MEDDRFVEPVLLLGQQGMHDCELPYRPHAYGAAVENCFEDDYFRLFVINGEYGSQVNFCPVCGYEAKNKIMGEK